jgi:glyoxylase-like metal-dependent hydrolase (beta-lactamase superfamily II)
VFASNGEGNGPVRVRRLTLGPLDTNCWVVSDDSGGPAVVIDPADRADLILEEVGGREIGCVILTHRHFDHIGAVRDVLEASGAPLAIHADDALGVTTSEGTGGATWGFTQTAPTPDVVLVAGDRIDAGELQFEVLHTPGHTPGGICLFAADPRDGSPHVFTGDTLFAGSVGRTDFEGGDASALARSIARELAPLSPETIVHPGHGPDTTVARESRLNPFWPRA